MIMELNFYIKDKLCISRKRDTSRRYNNRHYNETLHHEFDYRTQTKTKRNFFEKLYNKHIFMIP